MNTTNTVKIERQGRGTLTATGAASEVEAWRERYFRSYHPCGYGTTVRSTVANPDGTVTITVWRAASCD